MTLNYNSKNFLNEIKNNSFLECGDLTVDTKDSFDILMTDSDNGLRNYTLDNSLSGSHFRFNKQAFIRRWW